MTFPEYEKPPAADQPPADDPADQGGESVCWLPRVCTECGRLADDEPPTRCPRCGAGIGLDE
jgi:rubrerythrin